VTAASGDLLLILGDNVTRGWKQIIYFDSENQKIEGDAKPTTTISLPEMESFNLAEDLEIISDERGVRIARETGD